MSWIKKILGKKDKEKSDITEPPEDNVIEPDPETQAMLENGCNRREAFLSSLGAVDTDVMAPLMNPSFMGGPTWPSFRQSWRVVRRDNSILVASDGLTDPFEHEKIPLGFKLEVYADTKDEIDNVQGSWLLSLVYTVSQIMAEYGNVSEMLEKYNTLSTAAYIEGLPEGWVNEDGNAGILIGSLAEEIPNTISLKEGNIKFLSIKLLHPKELEFIESGGVTEEKRDQLVALFKGDHYSSLNRKPVV